MYFWTLPGPEGAVLGGAVVAVETSLTMGCTLGTVVVTGEVVVEPEPGAEVLRDRTWGKKGKAQPGGGVTCSVGQLVTVHVLRSLEAAVSRAMLGMTSRGLAGLLQMPLPAPVFGPRGKWALLWSPPGT